MTTRSLAGAGERYLFQRFVVGEANEGSVRLTRKLAIHSAVPPSLCPVYLTPILPRRRRKIIKRFFSGVGTLYILSTLILIHVLAEPLFSLKNRTGKRSRPLMETTTFGPA